MKTADKRVSPVWRRRLRGIVPLIGMPVLGLALLLSYGDLSLFLGCIGFIVGLALLAWRVMRFVSLSMVLLAVCALGVWGIDSSMRYPLLRGLQHLMPFGPSITVARSPSGQATAYIYDYSFLDSAYAVSFARGLNFPGERNWIRYDKAADFSITAKWEGEFFRVEAGGGPEVLTYSEAANRVILSK
jgi:hypothetical protein